MLQYRENINYYQAEARKIEAEIAELKELCKNNIDDYQLYQQIRAYIFREIKIKELAVTLILSDLLEIKEKSEKCFYIIANFVLNSDCSYKVIGDNLGVSKQYVYEVVTKYSGRYYWLDNLVKIKGQQDSVNDNNRSRFFAGKVKKENQYIQNELF